MKRILLTVFTVIISAFLANSADRITPEEYIAKFKEAAITDMKKTGVPASITLAQGMYESDFGNSDLARIAKNHFGIKCHKEWNGDTFHKDDDAPNECFRKYNTVLESYDDHSNFLRSRERYQSLFNLSITDYKGWAHGLKKAGYATNPQYASKIIGLIERFNLNALDRGEEINSISSNPINENEINKDPSIATHPTIFNKNKVAANGKTINGIPFTKVIKGDTWLKLSRNNNLELWQILQFNDAEKNNIIHENDIIYLSQKKAKGEQPTYTAKSGDSMRDISQMFGIRLKKLYQMNKMHSDTEVKVGQTLQLRKTVIFGLVL